MEAAAPQDLIDNMRYWLGKKRLTQAQLAKRAGVSIATVSRLCRGKVALSHTQTIDKIANAFGIEPQMLTEHVGASSLTPDQQELLRFYGRMTKTQQRAVITIVRDLASLKGST